MVDNKTNNPNLDLFFKILHYLFTVTIVALLINQFSNPNLSGSIIMTGLYFIDLGILIFRGRF